MNPAMCGLFRALLRLPRARPARSAASLIFLQSPPTKASIATMTFLDTRRAGASAALGPSSAASARLAGILGGAFSMIPQSALHGRRATHQNVTFSDSPSTTLGRSLVQVWSAGPGGADRWAPVCGRVLRRGSESV
jgi:hypothetical protein